MSGRNKKIKGCGFHHVSIKVRDLDESIRFYTKGLGFIHRFSWGQDPKRTVLLDTGEGNYFELSQGDPDQNYGDGIFRHFALRVDDCDAAIEVARTAGAEVTVEPKDIIKAGDPSLQFRIAFFKGPDGEMIELFQNDQT